jgi:NAD(P)-dependent dehydrogenase (short-subunit alcohol dehydrogenase family)
MKESAWLLKYAHSLEGKTVAVSGATGGLGRPLCRALARLGASLLLLDRNSERSEALAEELRQMYADCSVSHIPMDLTDFESVRRTADRLSARSVDYLILNAGAYSIPRKVCDTGYDNVFQINFLAPYYLARRLLPMIASRGGRVVAVGSIAHRYSKTDPCDIDFSNRRAASRVYGNAKRYLMFSLYELFKNSKRASLAVTHPGITFTNITAHYPKLIFALIKHPMKLIFMKPRRAALSILRGVFEPCAHSEWIGPRVFDIWGMPKRKRLRGVSPEECKHIARAADEAYGKIGNSEE